MALTKVGPAGIGSTPGIGITIGNSFLHTTGLESTNANFAGIVTAQTFRVLGNFQVDGTTTTLDTVVTEVDRLEVGANNSTVGVAITQSGSGRGLSVDGDAVISNTGANPLDLYKYGTNAPSILMYGANGTAASPTQTQTGDAIGGWNAFGYGSSGWAGGPSVRITAIATENNGTTSNRGADIKFETVVTGGTSLQERLRIKSDGKIGIGNADPNAELSVNNASSNASVEITRGASGAEYGYRIFGADGAAQTALKFFPVSNGSLGSEVARFDASGRLLLGTAHEGSSSADDLTVATSAETGITIRSGTSNPGNIFFSDGTSGNSEYRGFITYAHADDSMRFATVNTEALRITSDGDVYIGNIAHSNDNGANSSYRTLTLADTTNGAQLHLRGKSPKLYMDVTSGGTAEVYYDTGDFTISSGEPGNAGSTERLRITSTGNIGIGTDTPYANNSFNSLSIGGSGKYGLIELNKSDGVAGSWIDVHGTGGNGDLRITTAGTSGAITFWTGGSFTEKVRITSAGKLGIGTNNPQEQFVVSNSGAEGFEVSAGVASNVNKIVNYNRSGGSYSSLRIDAAEHIFRIGASERLRVNSAGNVTIGGNSNPDWNSTVDALTVGYAGVLYEDSYTSGTDNYVILGNNVYYANGGGNKYIRNDEASRIMMRGGNWWFQNASAGTAGNAITFVDRLHITSAGKVGINNASPAYNLSINGTGAVRNEIVCTNNNDAGAGVYFRTMNGGSMVSNATIRTDNAGNLQIFTGTSSDSERLRITSAGNVGIDQNNPTFKLDVKQGNVRVYTNDTWRSAGGSNGTTYPCIQLNADYAAANNPASGRVTVRTSSQNSYSGDIVLQPYGYYGGSYGFVEDVLRVSAHKRVGINVSNPSVALHVQKPSTGGATIKFTDAVNATGRLGTPSSGVVAFGGNTDHAIAFGGWTNNDASFSSEWMRITSAGLVGIGENSPDVRLHIKGGQHNFRIERTGTGPGYVDVGLSYASAASYASLYTTVESSGNTSDFIFRHGPSASYAEKFRIDKTGNYVAFGGSKVHLYGGSSNNNATFNIDLSMAGTYGTGLLIATGWHYGNASYGASRMSIVSVGPHGLIDKNIQNSNTSLGGTWTFSRQDNYTIRVSKTAGSYHGGIGWTVCFIGYS